MASSRGEHTSDRVDEGPIHAEASLCALSSRVRAFAMGATIVDRFEIQAARAPQAVALTCGHVDVTYADLNDAANAQAQQLKALGVMRGAVVGVWASRSTRLIVAVLAILKTGGAYLPLDPSFPIERLRSMVADSDASVVLADAARCGDLEMGRPVVPLEDFPGPATLSAPEQSGREQRLHDHGPCGDDLACITYTFGSTGAPKGVGMPHGAVVALVNSQAYAPLAPEHRVLQRAPFSVDAATVEIWRALLSGAHLVLAPPGPLDVDAVENTISSRTVDQSPGLLCGVRRVLTEGEVLPVRAAEKARALFPHLTVINLNGPTETTTFASHHEVVRQDLQGAAIPIGRALSGTRLLVLDEALAPVPIGAIGEFFIAGAGLARGYLRRPGLSSERIMACPFGPPGARMYRTGDRACGRTDGVLEFHGRLDDQLKIRGVRIVPGEVESAINGIEGVGRCAVIARETKGGL